MKSFNQKTSVSPKRPVFERIERIHPLKMINYLIISISCILFAVVSFLFIRFLAGELGGNYSYETPKFFVVGTLVLVLSTHFTHRIIKAFERDEIAELRKLISFNLISGLVFFLCQSMAWMEILKLNLTYNAEISNYLFLFSGVHFVFVLAGIVMSAIHIYRYMLIENDPVKILITTTNPIEKVKLEIYSSFWNFTVWSWGLIFLMLLFLF
jgi:cytochrome c oxidase subunit 3